MKTFLLKYKQTIIFWIVFLAVVLFFSPKQHDYYLDNDIKTFKKTYLTQILLWIGIVTSVAIFVLVLIKAKSVKQSAIASLSVSMTFAFYLFIFQDIFLGFSLFLNRQVKRDTLQRSYLVSYLVGRDQTKENFFPYDLSTRHVTTDKKLINKVYDAGLKRNDTIKVTFERGWFEIPFHSEPLRDD